MFRARGDNLQDVVEHSVWLRSTLFNNTHRIRHSQHGQACGNTLVYSLGALNHILTLEMGDKMAMRTGKEGSH